MTRNRSITFLATAGGDPLTALVLVSCGGGSNDATASTAQLKTASGPPATVGLANSDLGKILVDSQGRTPLPVQEGRGDEEHLLWRMCQRLAAAPGGRQAGSRQRRECGDVGTTTRSDGSHRSRVRANARQHRRAQPLYGTATRESRRIMWKRRGSGEPQQSAAAVCGPSFAERSERLAAVDRSTCSRLLSSGSQVRVLPGASGVTLQTCKGAPRRVWGFVPSVVELVGILSTLRPREDHLATVYGSAK